MKYAVYDKKYHFRYFFDSETGFYMRTGILDAQGKDTGIDPFMASFPHLMMWRSWARYPWRKAAGIPLFAG